MRLHKVTFPVGMALAIVSLYVAGTTRSEPPASAAQVNTIDARAAHSLARYQGATSCAAAACHNAGGPTGSSGSEYSTWLSGDPHATYAYAVLNKAESDNIVRRLRRDSFAVAATDQLCLKCHAPDPEAHLLADTLKDSSGTHADVSLHREGVSCESCHGPSEIWRRDHFSRDWQALAREGNLPPEFHLPRLRADAGSTDRGRPDLARRVQKCASCHVGDADREVNHDLIAAGHPPLFFEYAAYEAIYPNKHWRDGGPGSDHSVRAWAIGQVADAKAAVTLTRERARKAADPKASPRQIWPEFTEYSCFACHRNLQDSPRPRATAASRGLGTPPWSTWHTATLEFLAEKGGPFAARDLHGLQSSLKAVRDQMEKPYAQAPAVVAAADAMIGSLDEWLRDLTMTPPLSDEKAIRKLMVDLRDDVKDPRGRESLAQWESGMQHYLGLAACCNGLSDRKNLTEAQRQCMREIRDTLRFAPGFDGPRDYSPVKTREKILAIEP